MGVTKVDVTELLGAPYKVWASTTTLDRAYELYDKRPVDYVGPDGDLPGIRSVAAGLILQYVATGGEK